jgi:hypothetical protein
MAGVTVRQPPRPRAARAAIPPRTDRRLRRNPRPPEPGRGARARYRSPRPPALARSPDRARRAAALPAPPASRCLGDAQRIGPKVGQQRGQARGAVGPVAGKAEQADAGADIEKPAAAVEIAEDVARMASLEPARQDRIERLGREDARVGGQQGCRGFDPVDGDVRRTGRSRPAGRGRRPAWPSRPVPRRFRSWPSRSCAARSTRLISAAIFSGSRALGGLASTSVIGTFEASIRLVAQAA